MRTVMSFVLILLFGLLLGCESYAPTAPNDEEQAILQSDNQPDEECGTCGNPPPPGGGGGGGG